MPLPNTRHFSKRNRSFTDTFAPFILRLTIALRILTPMILAPSQFDSCHIGTESPFSLIPGAVILALVISCYSCFCCFHIT